jgi:hypothetical protein
VFLGVRDRECDGDVLPNKPVLVLRGRVLVRLVVLLDRLPLVLFLLGVPGSEVSLDCVLLLSKAAISSTLKLTFVLPLTRALLSFSLAD